MPGKVRYSGFLIPPLAKAAVNSALKKDGDQGVYGDLSGGLKDLETDSHVHIRGGFLYFLVSVSPDSGAGHGFSFKINKVTWRLKEDDTVYENVLEEEDDVDEGDGYDD